MGKIYFRGVQSGDAAYIAANLCEGERMTLRDTGQNAEEIVRMSVDMSPVAFAVMEEGIDQPIALFGAAPGYGNAAILWFLATDRVFQHRRAMLVEGRKMVALMLQKFPRLIGAVDTRHIGTLSWLRLLGCELGDIIDVGGVEMRYYSIGNEFKVEKARV